jgi:hypothetical protein
MNAWMKEYAEELERAAEQRKSEMLARKLVDSALSEQPVDPKLHRAVIEACRQISELNTTLFHRARRWKRAFYSACAIAALMTLAAALAWAALILRGVR